MKLPVLIPRIFDHPHTYSSGKFGKLKPGSIVLVPFGREKEIGVVWDKQEETKRKFQIKTILEKKSAHFNENIIKFVNWFSLYNLVPKGMVLKMFLGDKSFFSKSFNLSSDIESKKRIKCHLVLKTCL